MNERLKELLEQATEVHDYWYKGESQHIVNHKMFAELIVRECMDQCEEIAVSADKIANGQFVTDAGRMLHQGMWGGAKNCIVQIKEHFGVE